MNETFETIAEQTSLKDVFEQFRTLEPKDSVNRYFVPDNAAEQKEKFLAGEIEQPRHHYGTLLDKDYNLERKQLESLASQILEHPELNPKFKSTYEAFITETLQRNRFMATAQAYATAEGYERELLAAEYMSLNRELYSEPEEDTFRQLLGEKIARIDKKQLSGKAEEVREELHELVAGIATTTGGERFKPSKETIEWMHEVCESLFENLLSHVPEQEEFNDEQMKQIFEDILHQEFGDAAEGWEVIVEDAQSINVKASQKKIVIPNGRTVDSETMRGRIVHELGVHHLLPLMGGSTDLYPLSAGMPGYYNNEEGKGTIMEQALKSKYREAGAEPYITQGLAYFEQKSFRETFEIKWRLATLGSLKTGNELTDEAIEKSKATAYGATMRAFRGTDDMPWFQDVAYYNGAHDMWQHLESIRGDDLQFMFVMLGKFDPTNAEQRRVVLESSTA